MRIYIYIYESPGLETRFVTILAKIFLLAKKLGNDVLYGLTYRFLVFRAF